MGNRKITLVGNFGTLVGKFNTIVGVITSKSFYYTCGSNRVSLQIHEQNKKCNWKLQSMSKCWLKQSHNVNYFSQDNYYYEYASKWPVIVPMFTVRLYW